MKKKKAKILQEKTKEISIKEHVFKSLILIIGVTAFFMALYFFVPSYNNLFKNKIYENSKYIIKHKNYSLDKKYSSRLGKDYSFIQYVKKSVDEDAIILFPTREYFKDSVFNTKGSWGVKDPTWVTYFLYPRIVINDDWKQTHPDLYENYTHVFALNGWGFDKVGFNLSRTNKPMVIPRYRSDKH